MSSKPETVYGSNIMPDDLTAEYLAEWLRDRRKRTDSIPDSIQLSTYQRMALSRNLLTPKPLSLWRRLRGYRHMTPLVILGSKWHNNLPPIDVFNCEAGAVRIESMRPNKDSVRSNYLDDIPLKKPVERRKIDVQ